MHVLFQTSSAWKHLSASRVLTDISFQSSAWKFPHEVKFNIHQVSMQSRCTLSWKYDQFEVSARSEVRLKLFCDGLTQSKILLLKSQIQLLRFLRDIDLSRLSCLHSTQWLELRELSFTLDKISICQQNGFIVQNFNCDEICKLVHFEHNARTICIT